MDQLISAKIFEVVNGTLVAAFSCLLYIFCRYFFYILRDTDGARDRWRRFYLEARPAIAVTVVFAGEAVVRGSVWLARWTENHRLGDPFGGLSNFLLVATSGLLVGLWGAWCVARVYGGRVDAALTVVLSILFGLGMAYPW